MRRILIVASVSFGIHAVIFLLLREYRDLVFAIGTHFVHGTDIADIPPIVGAGFVVLAVLVVVGGVLGDRLVRRFW